MDFSRGKKSGKKTLIFIGLILFVAIAAIGIVIDFIKGSDGVIAIVSVCAAFLILAIFLIVDTIMRRSKGKNGETDGLDGDDGSAESGRFMRRSGGDEPVIEPSAGRSGYNGGYLGFPNDEVDDFDQPVMSRYEGAEEDAVTITPTRRLPFGSRRKPRVEENVTGEYPGAHDGLDDFDAQDEFEDEPGQYERLVRPSYEQTQDFDQPEQTEEQEYSAPTNAQSLFGRRAAQAQQAAPEDEYEEPQYSEPQEQFEPVIRNVGTEAEPQPVENNSPVTNAPEQPAAEPVQQSYYAPVQQSQPSQPTTVVEQSAPATAPAAAPAAAAVPAPVQPIQAEVQAPPQAPTGQTLESFYEDMDEETLLYRDCVEVWAADAKPSVLKLMKYIEGIEDKHTQALFGRECEYINALIDRIYCFTQLEYIDEMLDLKKYNFSALVKECLRRFSPFLMEKRIGLLWKSLDIDVVTDRRWFVFALTQIIFNSVEFTQQGGKIAISARKSGEYVDLMVDDNGKGITAEEMPYVFIAGYMGDESPNEAGRRTGMGLFIARSVLNKMGGDVFAESNPGKGTRITMRLPIRNS